MQKGIQDCPVYMSSLVETTRLCKPCMYAQRYWFIHYACVSLQDYGFTVMARYVPCTVLASGVNCFTETYFYHVVAQELAEWTLQTFAVCSAAVFIAVVTLPL